jgi:hypothetical protein
MTNFLFLLISVNIIFLKYINFGSTLALLNKPNPRKKKIRPGQMIDNVFIVKC